MAVLFRQTGSTDNPSESRWLAPMIIESKAPTRVDFAGGTLDIWPLYLFHPSAVTVNAAISLYASCVIETNDPGDSRIKLVSRDIKCEESFPSFPALVKAKRYRLPLLAEITKFFHPQGGFTLTTDSEAPAGAGIGGSSPPPRGHFCAPPGPPPRRRRAN